MNGKIALVSEHASPLATLGGIDSGGQNVYVSQLAKSLSQLGFIIDIFTKWDNPLLTQIIQLDKNIRVIHVSAGPKKYIKKEKLFPYMDDFYEHMIPFVEKEQYNVIHANFWMSAYVANRIKEELHIPYVVTFHALGKIRKKFQGKADEFPQERIPIEEDIVKNADHIIAECPQDREDLIYNYYANQDKISIIPCGFDPHEFYPIDKNLARMSLGLQQNEKIILQLGRLVPRKGIDTVIEALSLLKGHVSFPVRLLIVGGESDIPTVKSTPEIGRLASLAKKLHIENIVTFVGRRGREQLKYFYNAADVFVSTPWYEPFGITPLESMACGTPVIASQVGGLKFSVINGKTGFLIPPQNPQILSEKIINILENNKLSKLFSVNSIERVNSFFTWATVAQSVATLYEKIIYPKYSRIETYQKEATIVDANFQGLIEIIKNSQNQLRISIIDAARLMSSSLAQGGKILVCGNGGSASSSQHFATELVGYFHIRNRPGVRICSLTSDTTILTAVGNDFSFEEIFSRQVEAYGETGDIFFGISTSGNSKNIVKAFEKAREKNMISVGLLGNNGGECLSLCDIAIVVPSSNTQRIQEVHDNIIHTFSEIIEKKLFLQDPTFQPITGRKNGKAMHISQKEEE